MPTPNYYAQNVLHIRSLEEKYGRQLTAIIAEEVFAASIDSDRQDAWVDYSLEHEENG